MDNKDTMVEHGQFWLRSNEQRKLWGTLYVNELNESKLETFGSLMDPGEESLCTIVGQIRSGQEYVTLINCFPTNTTNWGWTGDDQTDWSHQTYLVNKVVEGIRFEKGEDIALEQAFLDISTLSTWANPKLVEVNLSEGGTRPIRMNVTIEDRQDETTTVRFMGEEVKISVRFRPKQGQSSHGVITSYQVEDHCHLMIERADGSLMPLDSILSVARVMLDILSVCCNKTATVDSFSVFREELKHRPANVYVGMRGYGVGGKEGYPYAALELKDFGGMEGVARWFEVAEEYGAAVTLLTSNWYNENAYTEDNFSRMYTAVEGLLSRKKNRNRARMNSDELATFAEEAIPGFSNLTNRPSRKWACSVKEIRDQKISHSDPTSTLKVGGRSMQVMTNQLYAAGVSFLLREMGMDNTQIDKYIKGTYQTLLLSEQR